MNNVLRLHSYSSTYQYCVKARGYSEDEACKRITAARAARRFPAIFAAIAEGRLHVSGVVALAPHLIPANAGELLCAAEHRTRAEIERLLAVRFPKDDVPTLIVPVGLAGSIADAGSPATVELSAPGRIEESSVTNATLFDGSSVEAVATSQTPDLPQQLPPVLRAMKAAEPSRLSPIASERFVLQATIGQHTHDKLRRAQELLGFAVAPGDIAAVLDRALDALIVELEKRRCGRTNAPRPARAGRDPRHVPAAVRRIVWARDHDQCTFVSEDGHRCSERSGLELDHVLPVAHGGESTPSNLRLRCRAHNQMEAERVFGTAFMARKREQARAPRVS